jgi:hypothetical protein
LGGTQNGSYKINVGLSRLTDTQSPNDIIKLNLESNLKLANENPPESEM